MIEFIWGVLSILVVIYLIGRRLEWTNQLLEMLVLMIIGCIGVGVIHLV